ncbi:hypothetical protein ACFFRR_010739 [Megaselia abdita]
MAKFFIIASVCLMGAMAQYMPQYNPGSYNPGPYNGAYNAAPYAPAYAPAPAVVISSYPGNYGHNYVAPAPYAPAYNGPAYGPSYSSYSPAVVTYPSSSSAETTKVENAKAVINNPYSVAAVPYVAPSYPSYPM